MNADISYVHHVQGGVSGPSSIPAIDYDEALSWIGSGRAESPVSSHGLSPALGIGYRYGWRHFRLDTGIGAAYSYTTNGQYAITDIQKEAEDSSGKTYTGYHSWTERRLYMQHSGVNIPFMLGGEWHGVCMMAGVKANMDVWGIAWEQGAYSLRGYYADYMDPIVNVPEHGFVADAPYSTAHITTSFSWDIRACAEISFRLRSQESRSRFSTRTPPRYYLGLFAEYAFAGTKQGYRPLMAGIRMAVLFPLPESKSCICLTD